MNVVIKSSWKAKVLVTNVGTIIRNTLKWPEADPLSLLFFSLRREEACGLFLNNGHARFHHVRGIYTKAHRTATLRIAPLKTVTPIRLPVPTFFLQSLEIN